MYLIGTIRKTSGDLELASQWYLKAIAAGEKRAYTNIATLHM